jgi:hypothetical protein
MRCLLLVPGDDSANFAKALTSGAEALEKPREEEM